MWLQDIRYAVRALVRNPGLTLIAAGSLALGIGANAAIFSLADAMLFRPLPVARPDDVVALRNRTQDRPSGASYASVSWRDYADYRDRSRSFDGLVAYSLTPAGLAPRAEDAPRLTLAMLVSGNFFGVLGVEPALGRGFRPEEDAVPGRDPVAVLGYATWVSVLGADPHVLGRSVRLNGVAFTVVGVAPASFWGMDVYNRPAVFVPLMMAPTLLGSEGERLIEARDARSLNVKGRLRAGVGLRQAEAELGTIAAQLEQSYPDTNRNQRVAVRTELQSRIERYPVDAALAAMAMALAAVVLLIACANVANLLLSRAAARAREIALRLAVGAGRVRLVRQLVTENLLLALLGAVLGLFLAAAAVRFFSGLPIPSDLPVVLDVRLDLRVFLFSLGAAVVSVLVFGLAPALRTTRPDLVPALKAGEAGVSARGRLSGARALVVAQVALSFVLLAAAASLMRGLEATVRGEAGFRRDGLLIASFDPTLLRYTPERSRAFYRELVDRARLLPGVTAVTLTYAVPLGNRVDVMRFIPEGYTLPEGRRNLPAFASVVDGHYFDTFGVGLVKGRAFSENDDGASPRVVIVNEVMARKYWADSDPVGKRLRLDDAEGPWAEVVGVARTHKYMWSGEAPREFAYRPFAQSDQQRMTLVLACPGDPAALAGPVRELARSVDADVPIHDVRTMDDLYTMRAVREPGMIVETIGSMGALGLALALVGLYGLTAYSVSRRTREIGIRMALGADRGRVLGLILRQGVGLALAGVAIGAVASLGVTRALGSVVFGVAPVDPLAFLAVPAALLCVAAAASVLPARRASRIDPVKALRFE